MASQYFSLSVADLEKIRSASKLVIPKLYSREELIENYTNRKDKKMNMGAIKAYEKMLEEKQNIELAKENHLNMLAAEEVERKKQEKEALLERSNMQTLFQDPHVREFNALVIKTQIYKENDELLKLNREHNSMAREREQRFDREMLCKNIEALQQTNDGAQQRRQKNVDLAEQLKEQVKDKRRRYNEMYNRDKEKEEYRYLYELAKEDDLCQEQLALQAKKDLNKELLDDIAKRKVHKQKEAQVQRIQELERKLAQLDIEEKKKQREKFNKQDEESSKLWINKQLVMEKFSENMKAQADAIAMEETKRQAVKAAQEETFLAKEKQNKERRAAMTNELLVDYRRQMQEKEQRKKEAEEKKYELLNAVLDSDKLQMTLHKQRGQRSKYTLAPYVEANFAMIADREARVLQQQKEDQELELMNAKVIAEKDKLFKKYINFQSQRAIDENRNATELMSFSKGYHGPILS